MVLKLNPDGGHSTTILYFVVQIGSGTIHQPLPILGRSATACHAADDFYSHVFITGDLATEPDAGQTARESSGCPFQPV